MYILYVGSILENIRYVNTNAAFKWLAGNHSVPKDKRLMINIAGSHLSYQTLFITESGKLISSDFHLWVSISPSISAEKGERQRKVYNMSINRYTSNLLYTFDFPHFCLWEPLI